LSPARSDVAALRAINAGSGVSQASTNNTGAVVFVVVVVVVVGIAVPTKPTPLPSIPASLPSPPALHPIVGVGVPGGEIVDVGVGVVATAGAIVVGDSSSVGTKAAS
jgi:hypothetical protein